MNNLFASFFTPPQTVIIIAVAVLGVLLIVLNVVLWYVFHKRGERKLYNKLLQKQREQLMQKLEEMRSSGDIGTVETQRSFFAEPAAAQSSEPPYEEVREPAEELIEEPSEELVEEPSEEAEEPAEETYEELIEEPSEESFEDFVEETVEELAEETVDCEQPEEVKAVKKPVLNSKFKKNRKRRLPIKKVTR